MKILSWLERLIILSLGLTLMVILLGAYTRLSDAGLGCPDWPGCYGQLSAPATIEEIDKARTLYPSAPVDERKARIEMIHRYAAGSLGCFIILFTGLIYWKRQALQFPLWLSTGLIMLILCQGLLGMLTVTLQLLPVIVLGHLLGGFCTLGLLWLCWLYLRKARLANRVPFVYPTYLAAFTLFMLLLLMAQITLGGWTSANYAALICPDFPTCQAKWWPSFSLKAFHFLGIMDSSDKTTIHFSHRLGAVITFLSGLIVSLILWREVSLRKFSLLLVGGLFVQLGLGIANILLHLPLTIAIAHNGMAALLLLLLIALNFAIFSSRWGTLQK